MDFRHSRFDLQLRRARPASGTSSSDVGSYAVSCSSVMWRSLSGESPADRVGWQLVGWSRAGRSCEQVDNGFGGLEGGVLVLEDRGADRVEGHHQPADLAPAEAPDGPADAAGERVRTGGVGDAHADDAGGAQR